MAVALKTFEWMKSRAAWTPESENGMSSSTRGSLSYILNTSLTDFEVMNSNTWRPDS